MTHRRFVAPRALVALLALGAAALPSAGTARGAEDAPQPPSPIVRITRTAIQLSPHSQVPFQKKGAQSFAPGSYAALQKALVELRKHYPKLPAIMVLPSPDTPWDVVMQTIAHVRKDAQWKPLFPVVVLGIGI